MYSLFGKMNMGSTVSTVVKNSARTINKTRSHAAPRAASRKASRPASRKASNFTAQLQPTRKSYSRKSRSERALNRSMGRMGDE